MYYFISIEKCISCFLCIDVKKSKLHIIRIENKPIITNNLYNERQIFKMSIGGK